MITVNHLKKCFGTNTIFDDFNLQVDDGEFLIIMGESGSGKTTLLNMIGGIEPYDDGEILVDDIRITSNGKMKDYYLYKVGFLFQNFALVENKTVEENLNFVQKKSRTGRSVDEVLNEVGLQDKKKAKVYQLSGGEQQRVAIARLMYKKCDLILADEPTGSLDAKNAKIILEILRKINKQGTTVVVVTHDERIIDEDMRIVTL